MWTLYAGGLYVEVVTRTGLTVLKIMLMGYSMDIPYLNSTIVPVRFLCVLGTLSALMTG